MYSRSQTLGVCRRWSRSRLQPTTLQSVDEVSPEISQLGYTQTIEIEGVEKPALVAESLVRVYL